MKSKKCLVIQIVSLKKFDLKLLWLKIYFGQNIFWSKKIWGPRNFGPGIFLRPKNTKTIKYLVCIDKSIVNFRFKRGITKKFVMNI